MTNTQYLAFVEATGRKPPLHWEGGKPPGGKEDHPVVYVSWHHAMAYCQWLAKTTGRAYRLPSEAEWEKAARGGLRIGKKDNPYPDRIYPWGNERDEKRCNSGEGGLRGTTPVGQYSPGGDSPYGCVDMAGNVWEWTLSLWGKELDEPDFKYPYDPEDGREMQRLRAGARCAAARGTTVKGTRASPPATSFDPATSAASSGFALLWPLSLAVDFCSLAAGCCEPVSGPCNRRTNLAKYLAMQEQPPESRRRRVAAKEKTQCPPSPPTWPPSPGCSTPTRG